MAFMPSEWESDQAYSIAPRAHMWLLADYNSNYYKIRYFATTYRDDFDGDEMLRLALMR